MSSWPLQSVSIPNSFSLSRLLSHLHGFLTLSGAAIILLAHFYPSLFQKKRKHYYTIPDQIQIFVLSKGDEEKIDEYCGQILLSLENSLDKILVLGFDAEWKPHTKSTHNKVALLQLCDDKRCYLIRLFLLDFIPEKLKILLVHSRIIKVGVGILNDVRQLWRDYQIEVKGCLDLQPLAMKYNLADNGTGLSSLCWTTLEAELQKSHIVQCSNWERTELIQKQIIYAATDAWVSREIFFSMFKNYNPTSLNPYDWCSIYIDSKSSIPSPKISGPKQTPTEKPFRSHIRKSLLYENCKMFSPEGVLLCTISHKKANWYLTRNIAEKISDEPLHIRLKFQPKGKGHADDPYYISEKQNCCVVCGFDENFLRFSIVPHGFKKHFEEILKSRDSHDIILLCQKCLEKANLGSSRLKETLSKELQIPLEGIGAKFDLDKDLAKVKMAASALKLSQNLPQSRREELESILKKHLGKETITVEDIESLASTSVKSARSDFIPFEQAVVERIKKEGKVVEFVRRWRENFVKTMKPKFLPKYWSIDHPLNIEREEYILKSSK